MSAFRQARWQELRSSRIVLILFAFSLIFSLLAAFPAANVALGDVNNASDYDPPAANPPLEADSCALNVLLILDETGSLVNTGTLYDDDVRDGVTSFLGALSGTSAQVGLVEFSSISGSGNVDTGTDAARLPLGSGYRPPTDAAWATYLANDYEPQNNYFTNWEAAFRLASETFTGGNAPDLVVFFTDGQPNTVLDDSGSDDNNPANGATDNTVNRNDLVGFPALTADPRVATLNAIDEANALKAAGAHLIGFGLFPGGTTGQQLEALQLVTGPDEVGSVISDDWLSTGDVDAFVAQWQALAEELCSPRVDIDKTATGESREWEFDVQVDAGGPFRWNSPDDAPDPVNGVGTATVSTTVGGGNTASTETVQWTPDTYGDGATVVITEKNIPDDWELTELTCSDGSGTPLVDEDQDPASFTISGVGIEAQINCTATNEQDSLEQSKTFNGASRNADGSFTATYDISTTFSSAQDGKTKDVAITDTPDFSGDLSIDGVSWTLNGDTSSPLEGSTTLTEGVEQTVTVTVDFSDPGNDGYDDACNGSGSGLFNGATVDGNPVSDCGDVPIIDHEKQAVEVRAVDGVSGRYQVAYDVTVTNEGQASGTYSLDDAPGTQPTGVTVVDFYLDENENFVEDGGEDLDNTGDTLATNESLAAGATDTYRVVLVVDIPGDLELDCDGNTGGIVNTATVFQDQWSDTTSACSEIPPEFSITKVAGDATAIDAENGIYEITYTITVDNIGGATGSYTLTDTPEFDDDLDITEVEVTDPDGAVTTITDTNVIDNPPWPLGGGTLAPGDTADEWTLTVTVDSTLIDENPAGDEIYSVCPAQDARPDEEGLGNVATVAWDDQSRDAWDCADIPADLTLEKSDATVTDNGDGTWDVSYDVTVGNLGGQSESYTVTDTAEFDENVEIIGTPTGFDAWNPSTNSGTITGTVGGGSTDVTTVTFTVGLDYKQGDGTYESCDEPQSGLFNGVEIVGTDLTSDGCGDLPPVFEVDKDFISATSNGGGDFEVVYELEVTNVGGVEGDYTLTDTPDFDDDVEITQVVIEDPSGGEVTITDDATIGNPPWTLGSGTLAGNESETWTLTLDVTLDLTDGVGNDDYEGCELRGDSLVPGDGLFNSATVSWGDPEQTFTDEDCGDLPGDLTIDKTDSGAVLISSSDAEDVFELTYDVTVTNTGGTTAEYILGDRPDFDDVFTITGPPTVISVDGTAISPALPDDDAYIIGNGLLSSGESHTYTVAFTASVDREAVEEGGYDACDLGEGGLVPGNGAYNEAGAWFRDAQLQVAAVAEIEVPDIEVPDGSPDVTDDACQDVPVIFLEKTATDLAEDENVEDRWEIEYTINVENLGGATGEYDLQDDFGFGAGFGSGFTVVPGSVEVTVVPASIVPRADFDGASQETIVEEVEIDGGVTHTYTVGAAADIDFSEAETECFGEPGGGFFNEAFVILELDEGTATLRDDACLPVERTPRPGILGDFVFEDTDQDGIQDAGEPGIPGVTVNVYIAGTDTLVDTTTTDADGLYEFELLPTAEYEVEFVLPDGYDGFSPANQGGDDEADSDAGTDGRTGPVQVDQDVPNRSVDAGLIPTPTIEVALEPLCYNDIPLLGYTVSSQNIIDPSLTISFLETDAGGTLLPGGRSIVYPGLPLGEGLLAWPGVVLDQPGFEGVNLLDTFTVDQIIAGDINPTDWPGWVFDDFDGDGAPEWAPVDDGFQWVRELPQILAEVNPEFRLVVEYPPATPRCVTNPPASSVGDIVWEDLDGDGIQDADEVGVEGVTVNLYRFGDGITNLERTTTTDANGAYLFDFVEEGEYQVEFILPGGFVGFTVPNAGSDDGFDSDADPETGLGPVFNLGPGEVNLTFDAGLLVEVLPQVEEEDELPETGYDAGRVALIGGLVLLGGGALLLITRRKDETA